MEQAGVNTNAPQTRCGMCGGMCKWHSTYIRCKRCRGWSASDLRYKQLRWRIQTYLGIDTPDRMKSIAKFRLRCAWGRTGYRPWAKLIHKFNYHHTEVIGPLMPDGSTLIKCGWCRVSKTEIPLESILAGTHK